MSTVNASDYLASNDKVLINVELDMTLKMYRRCRALILNMC